MVKYCKHPNLRLIGFFHIESQSRPIFECEKCHIKGRPSFYSHDLMLWETNDNYLLVEHNSQHKVIYFPVAY